MPTSLPPRIPLSEREKHASAALLIMALALTTLLVLTEAHARYGSAWLETALLITSSGTTD